VLTRGRRVTHDGRGIYPAQFRRQSVEFCGSAHVKVARAMPK
jgi:hypothetical protein